MKTLIDYLQPEDLSDDLRDIAEELGLDIVKVLLKNFPHTGIYVPDIKNITPTVRRMIADRVKTNGNTYRGFCRKLVRETGLSEPHISKLVRQLEPNINKKKRD